MVRGCIRSLIQAYGGDSHRARLFRAKINFSFMLFSFVCMAAPTIAYTYHYHESDCANQCGYEAFNFSTICSGWVVLFLRSIDTGCTLVQLLRKPLQQPDEDKEELVLENDSVSTPRKTLWRQSLDFVYQSSLLFIVAAVIWGFVLFRSSCSRSTFSDCLPVWINFNAAFWGNFAVLCIIVLFKSSVCLIKRISPQSGASLTVAYVLHILQQTLADNDKGEDTKNDSGEEPSPTPPNHPPVINGAGSSDNFPHSLLSSASPDTTSSSSPLNSIGADEEVTALLGQDGEAQEDEGGRNVRGDELG
jgi:hypothetical protein